MKTLTDHLSQYAAYHQDGRNVATHFVGIPMIVVAVATLLCRPLWMVGDVPMSPATIATVLSCLFYLRLDLRFGLTMTVLMALSLAAGQWFAAQSTAIWLGAGLGLFVVGWAFQFLGHHYEGRKPAFVDDLSGLIVGPLFLVAEAAFHFNMRPTVKASVEARLGSLLPAHGSRANATAVAA
jgi:uncharacterized membrane protein YGL010W